MGELGVLRDFAQAGPGIAQLRQCLEGRGGKLLPALGKFVDLPSRYLVSVAVR